MRVKSSVYLEENLKNKAKQLLKEYGLSLSDGINLALKEFLSKKDLPFIIEPIDKNDPAFKELEEAKNKFLQNPQEYMDFDEWKKSLNV